MVQTPEQVAEERSAMLQQMKDMTDQFAALTAEMAKRPATNALEALVGLPANPLAFPPGANGTYPVLVTSLLHPHLLPDVIAQIRKFEFPPSQLGRLLKGAAVMPPTPMVLVRGPGGEALFSPATPVPGATSLIRELPDILSFVDAWVIFTSVLQNERLTLPISQSLSAHLGNIVALARGFTWANVLDYHVAFVLLRMRDPFLNPMNWAQIDPHLHTLHLLMPSFTQGPATPLSPPAATAQSPYIPRDGRFIHAAGTPPPNQVCWNFNQGRCAGPAAAACVRRHVCQNCLQIGHTAPFCREVAAENAAATAVPTA